VTLPRLLLVALVAVAAGLAGVAACNTMGDCPTKAQIVPDASCGSDSLQCAYDLPTPTSGCVIPTSCACSGGVWVCPSGAVCPDAGATDSGASDGPLGDAGSDASSGHS
jgi:hypothetical protein